VLSNSDFGGHGLTFTYNSAGQLTKQSNGSTEVDYTYTATGQLATMTDTAHRDYASDAYSVGRSDIYAAAVVTTKAVYAYDNNGNRVRETYFKTGTASTFYENAGISYDALNRVTEYKDSKTDITYSYDANGNRRECATALLRLATLWMMRSGIMRSSLQKMVFSRLASELQSRLPQFTPLPKQGALRLWQWAISDALTFFIGYQPIKDKDEFVLEVAWSEDGEFPWEIVGKIFPRQPKGRERLGFLWQKVGWEPVWNLAPEMTAAVRAHTAALIRNEHLPYPDDPPVDQLKPRIEPLVIDAVDKLEQYGIPLFREIAKVRGIGDRLLNTEIY
jgi:YD repeat-containing protein